MAYCALAVRLAVLSGTAKSSVNGPTKAFHVHKTVMASDQITTEDDDLFGTSNF